MRAEVPHVPAWRDDDDPGKAVRVRATTAAKFFAAISLGSTALAIDAVVFVAIYLLQSAYFEVHRMSTSPEQTLSLFISVFVFARQRHQRLDFYFIWLVAAHVRGGLDEYCAQA